MNDILKIINGTSEAMSEIAKYWMQLQQKKEDKYNYMKTDCSRKGDECDRTIADCKYDYKDSECNSEDEECDYKVSEYDCKNDE